ncbi:hypothetical protein ABW636_05080 [Aquimarina sp. 2201CG1-2-11]|uniref:hypothetical protein n=1 Tax=Aquimarina discodermiae TaxID=3231043 RepID=UPI0034635A68
MDTVKHIIKLIKEKPSLYLPYTSIRCFKSFILGWYTRNPDLVKDFNLLEHDFMKWIHSKYNIEVHSWDKTIEFFSRNEYEALDLFFELFEEFLEENTSLSEE